MAKVHKAHKSTKKYSFQKKHIPLKTWLILLAVVVVAGIGLKLWYDSYIYGEFDVAAPSAEKMNTIAQNWENLNADTEHFMNIYDLYGYATDGVYNGYVSLSYYPADVDYYAEITILSEGWDLEDTQVDSLGYFNRTTLTDAINGVAKWGEKEITVAAGNTNITVYVYGTDDLSGVIDELVALSLTAPTAEAVEEAADEVPAE